MQIFQQLSIFGFAPTVSLPEGISDYIKWFQNRKPATVTFQMVYCINKWLGGITSLDYNVINNRPYRGDDGIAINIDEKEWITKSSNNRFPADEELFFTYSVKDNAYAVIKRLFHLASFRAGCPGVE